jgi:hypothetical protein
MSLWRWILVLCTSSHWNQKFPYAQKLFLPMDTTLLVIAIDFMKNDGCKHYLQANDTC